VGAPGGASGNFQSRVSTISLSDTSGGDSLRGHTEEEEEDTLYIYIYNILTYVITILL
jgi:hypothetical protein